jgi:hypothetical protein
VFLWGDVASKRMAERSDRVQAEVVVCDASVGREGKDGDGESELGKAWQYAPGGRHRNCSRVAKSSTTPPGPSRYPVVVFVSAF